MKKYVFRYGRLIILLILSLLVGNLKGSVDGFSVFFGAGMLLSAFFTLIYVFMNFDKDLNEKLLMEMIVDGFSGLVLFTYPQSDTQFFVVVFSFWIAFQGVLMLSAGLFDKSRVESFWFYVLSGIAFIVFGFSILHVTIENQGILNYLMAFVLIIYAASHCRFLCFKKEEIY